MRLSKKDEGYYTIPAQDKDIVCPDCGNDEFTMSKKEDVFKYGCGEDAVELTALVPVDKCVSCGFAFTGAHAEDLREEAIRRHRER